MLRQRWVLAGIICLLALAAFACTIPGRGEPQPAATPTPLGDTLSFFLPTYTASLDPGETVPGTRLEYVHRSGDAYTVRIDGLEATKRPGDSFIWDGVIAPGVYGNFNLRLATSLLGSLPVAGPVELVVLSPTPEMVDSIPIGSATLHYESIVINYHIPAGRQIPGTTLQFDGIVSRGEGERQSQLAQLSGGVGYPFLAIGDSLSWTGQLRENVYIHYNLRLVSMGEGGMRLGGTAELWIR